MRSIIITITSLILLPILATAQFGDCGTAKDVCNKATVKIRSPKGEGQDQQEADFMNCFMNGTKLGQAEENSTWIKFEIKEGGSLAFTIKPDESSDDLDFVVFRLNASGDCKKKEVVRCMASGDRGEFAANSPCMGSTGLRSGEWDSSTDAGCSDKNDNAWLAPLKTIKGEKYVILISNVSGPRGFSISFSGSAKLPCEEPSKPIAANSDKSKPTDKSKTTKPIVPPKKEPEPVKVTVVEKPAQINGRDVVVEKTVEIKNRKIKVKIWDSQLEDGDVVSLYLDEKVILDHYKLTTKPHEFEFELPAGQNEHYLTVFADDFGRSEPNTAAVIISDGTNEQRINLTAGRKKQDSVKIIIQ